MSLRQLRWLGRLFFTSKEVAAFPCDVQLALLAHAQKLEPGAFVDDGVCFERLEASTHWLLRQWFRKAFPKGYDENWSPKTRPRGGSDSAQSPSPAAIESNDLLLLSEGSSSLKRKRGRADVVVGDDDDSAGGSLKESEGGSCGLVATAAFGEERARTGHPPPVLTPAQHVQPQQRPAQPAAVDKVAGRKAECSDLGLLPVVKVDRAVMETVVGGGHGSGPVGSGVTEAIAASKKLKVRDRPRAVLRVDMVQLAPRPSGVEGNSSHCRGRGLERAGSGGSSVSVNGDVPVSSVRGANGPSPTLSAPLLQPPQPAIPLFRLLARPQPPKVPSSGLMLPIRPPPEIYNGNVGSTPAGEVAQAAIAAKDRHSCLRVSPTSASSELPPTPPTGRRRNSCSDPTRPSSPLLLTPPAGPYVVTKTPDDAEDPEPYSYLYLRDVPTDYVRTLDGLGLDEPLPRVWISADQVFACRGVGFNEMQRARVFLLEIQKRLAPTGERFMEFLRFLTSKPTAATRQTSIWASENPSATPGSVLRILMFALVPGPGTKDQQRVFDAIGCDRGIRLRYLKVPDVARLMERLCTVLPELARIPVRQTRHGEK